MRSTCGQEAVAAACRYAATSSTDEEYHNEDPLGVFGVITGAAGAVLSSHVFDGFSDA